MVRVLVLGSDGMLGNAVVKYLSGFRDFHVYKTHRTLKSSKSSRDLKFVVKEGFVPDLVALLDKVKPDWIVNCLGVIRPGDTFEDYKLAIMVNSVLPKVLSLYCEGKNSKIIHISTDCVFSGKKGDYLINDIPDEVSVYGVSKLLGEARGRNTITIRTSIIGIEIGNRRNLLNWFLENKEGTVPGYSNVFWNGVTTLTLAKIIHRIVSRKLEFDEPILQVCSEKLSKFDLLNIFNEVFDKKVTIVENKKIKSDKTLKPSLVLKEHFSDLIQPLKEQIKELKIFYGL
ncbi:MAG: sugar nucleotide-binding protein [Candidatus Paceibacterota bacterium]